jgi:hypothetical protein
MRPRITQQTSGSTIPSTIPTTAPVLRLSSLTSSSQNVPFRVDGQVHTPWEQLPSLEQMYPFCTQPRSELT